MTDFKVGDKVHVEFDGTVYEYPGEYMRHTVSPNHVAVTDGSYIHHVHRSATDIGSVTVLPPSRPAVEVGQVWRNGNDNYFVYGGAKNMDPGAKPLFISPECKIDDEASFFTKYPHATLVFEADGFVA